MCRPARAGLVALASIAGVACLASCGGPSAADRANATNPACALVTSAQAGHVLGRRAIANGARAGAPGESVCTWRAASSQGSAGSFEVLLYQSTSAVQTFRSELAAPAAPVTAISIGGVRALWRPAAEGAGGEAFVSAVGGGRLVTVAASGGVGGADAAAKSAMAVALATLRSGSG